MLIGYDKIVKNQASARLGFTSVGIVIFILVSIFMYKLIDKKVIPKKE
jgi:hypothetical protein